MNDLSRLIRGQFRLKVKNDLVTNSSSTSYSIGNRILEYIKEIESLLESVDDDEYVLYQDDIKEALDNMNRVYKKLAKLEDDDE